MTVSVIIPTHNRADSVCRVAEAVDTQICSMPFEIVFVLDGCTDNSRQILDRLKLLHVSKIVETPGLGAAAARNRGASAASGELLVFVDDDVVPQPGMLDAHVRRHSAGKRLAVVGPCPYAPEKPVDPLNYLIREWWHEKYCSLADPGHHFTFLDCLSGNFSIRKDDFIEIGGFDEDFSGDGREDYELGCRLLAAGVELQYAPDAPAFHYPVASASSLIRKNYAFGRADVQFCLKHPGVFSNLPLPKYTCRIPLSHKALRSLAVAAGPVSLWLMGKCFELNINRLWNRRWLKWWYRASSCAYLMGAISAAGSFKALNSFFQQYADTGSIVQSQEVQHERGSTRV